MSASKYPGPIQAESPQEESAPGEQRVRIDGFNQVLEMLRVADPAFRESLLRRLAKRDPRLAETLRQDLE